MGETGMTEARVWSETDDLTSGPRAGELWTAFDWLGTAESELGMARRAAPDSVTKTTTVLPWHSDWSTRLAARMLGLKELAGVNQDQEGGASAVFVTLDIPSAGAGTKTTTTRYVESDRCDWVTETTRRLAELAALGPGWDGRGSEPISSPIVLSAMDLLARLQSEIRADFPEPFVCPIAGGGVQLEWTSDAKHLELEFTREDTVVFLTEGMPDGPGAMNSGQYDPRETGWTLGLLDWFCPTAVRQYVL